MYRHPSEETLEQRVRNMTIPEVLDQEECYRQYSPRGVSLSKYKLHPPPSKPNWRPTSLAVGPQAAKQRLASDFSHRVPDLLSEEEEETIENKREGQLRARSGRRNEGARLGTGDGQGAGHAEEEWRLASKYKIHGLPGKVPWKVSNPPTDCRDLLMYGGEAQAAGQYLSPDLLSVCEHPKRGLREEIGIHPHPAMIRPGVEPGDSAAKELKRYQSWKQKGSSTKKPWRPSSEPTGVREAKMLGSSANATGQYLSLDLRSSGQVPGSGLKLPGHPLAISPQHQPVMQLRQQDTWKPIRTEYTNQCGNGFKRKTDGKAFIHTTPTLHSTHKNKMGFIHGEVVS